MGSVALAVLQSWSFDPWPTLAVALVGWTYLRGWRRLRRQVPQRFPVWRLAAFWGGLATLLVAIASPLDAFAGLLLQVHMSQHVLLMLVAPPLVWLGAPIAPLLRGLPPRGLKSWLGPFLAWPALRRLARRLVHPAVALPVFVGTTWIWHAPALYELALRSSFCHRLEHACFFGSALLFWWPVVQPWPSRAAWPRWMLVPYLLLAHLQNTAFSALFAFGERVIYPTYEAVPRLAGITALDDQAVAGAIMWIPGSLLLLAAVVLVLRELLEAPRGQPTHGESVSTAPRARKARASPLDLLRTRSPAAWLLEPRLRRVVQAIALVLAVAVVLDGLLGPSLAPLNLAGVLPWTWWRGLVVVGILVLGNVGCLACPFLLPRSLARRWRPARRRWPRALRSKWLAVGGLLLYLFAYEALAPWNRPALTAAIVLGYFVGATVVDAYFRGASFCKYLCPIGQFQFLSATLSPFEVRARDPGRCTSCTTHDCLRGNERQRGCELELFQPAKVGNLDCTFCLDCVSACPHDNVGILPVTPGRQLVLDPVRSSLGRLSRRPDVAVLALILVFGAFANAASMVAPVMRWQMRLAGALDLGSPGFLAGMVLLALLAASVGVAALCAAAARRLGGLGVGRSEVFCRFALSLLPLGFSMWLAHLGLHLATGAGAIVPAVQRAVGELGIAAGPPRWQLALPASLAPELLDLQILALGVGWLATLQLGWRIAADYWPHVQLRRLLLCAPWALLSGALYGWGVWVLFQPMQMRGTLLP